MRIIGIMGKSAGVSVKIHSQILWAGQPMSTGYSAKYPSSPLLASVLLEGQIQFLCSSCQSSGSGVLSILVSRHKKSEFECAHQTCPGVPYGAPHFSFTHTKSVSRQISLHPF